MDWSLTLFGQKKLLGGILDSLIPTTMLDSWSNWGFIKCCLHGIVDYVLLIVGIQCAMVVVTLRWW
jgi:hypothetical protein